MNKETGHSSLTLQTEDKTSSAEVLSPEDFAKLVPAIGKNMSVLYILDMARSPNQGYGVKARPIGHSVDRDFQSIDWYFLKPNRLTGDVWVGTQHYHYNCEDRERRVYAPKLSKRGKGLGVPAAGLMADFASRNGIVLDRVFLEDTFCFYHPGDDVIQRRLELLKEIAAVDGVFRCDDYREKLKRDKTIAERRDTASSLSRLRWVEYDSRADERGWQTGFSYKPTIQGQAALRELLTTLEGIRTQDPDVLQRGAVLADEIKSDTDELVGLAELVKADRVRQYN